MRVSLLLALLLVLVPSAHAQEASNDRDTRVLAAPPPPADARPAVARSGGLAFYADRAAFDAANPDLPAEDFEDVHIAGLWCASFSPVDAGTDDDCYDPGTLMAPLGVAAVGPTQHLPDAMIAHSAGYFGQPSAVLGANLGVDTTEVRFDPGVHAVGLDAYTFISVAEVRVTVFDTGGAVLGTTTFTGTPEGRFFGVRSDGALIGAVRFAEDEDYVFVDDVAMGAYGGAVTFDPSPLVAALDAGATGTASVTLANHAAQPAAYEVVLATAPRFVTGAAPAVGTIPAGGSASVTVTFDAAGLIEARYTGSLVVETDLPTSPDAFVLPVVLDVDGEAACAFETDPIVFAPTIVGASSTADAVVRNAGTAACQLEGASAGAPFAVAGFTAGALAPGASAAVTVAYTPTEAGSDAGTLTVQTDGGPLTAALEGSALDPPTPAVDPVSLAFEVLVGESAAQPLTLSNTGGDQAAALDYSIFVAEVEPSGRGGEVTLTHSASQTIVAGTGVNCPTPPTSWWRVFDLGAFGVDTELRISHVDVGVEAAPVAATTTVRLYTLDGPLLTDNLTLVATAPLEVGPGDALSVVPVPVLATLPAGAVLAVEWEAGHEGVVFGANSAGQTGPTYMQADGCGAPEPFDIALAGFGDSHWVLNVRGEDGPPLVTATPSSGSIAPGDSEEITVAVDAAGFAPGPYAFELRIATNDPNHPTVTVPVAVEVRAATAAEDDAIPTAYALYPNQPNPFADATAIRYALPEAGPVRLEVFDATGRRVAVLVDGERPAGVHVAAWDTRGLASGLYLCRLRADTYARTLRMTLLR